MFTEYQLKTYEDTGFLVAKGLFNTKEARQISDWTDEVAGFPETSGKYMMYFEKSLIDAGQRILSRIENFIPYHDAFAQLIAGSKMRGGVSQLLGEPAVLFKDKINFKMPGADGFTPHQDVQAGWDNYASLHITALVSIDAATIENGCIEIAGGHHRRGLAGGMWEPLAAREMEGMMFEPCVTQPGDVVFFDSYTPHRSGPNLTDLRRRVLYVTYNRLSAGDHRVQYYADKRKGYPPDCERDPDKEYTFRV